MDQQSLLPLTLSALLATALHVGVLSLPRPAEADASRDATPTQPLTPPVPEQPEKPLEPEPKTVKPEPPEPPKPQEPEKPEAEPEPEPPTPPPAPPELSDETPEPLQMEIGKEDAPRIATIAWISHDDFRELQAMQSRTLQPGLQREAIAQADAPINFEPAQPAEQFGMPELATGVVTQDPGASRDASAERQTSEPLEALHPASTPEAPAPAEPTAADTPPAEPALEDLPPAAPQETPAPPTLPDAQDVAVSPEATENDPDPASDASAQDVSRPEPVNEQLALGPVTEPRPTVTDIAASPTTQPAPADAKPAGSGSTSQPAGEKPRQGDGGQMDQTRNLATQESPTSVTQSDRESTPTQLTPPTDQVQLGAVVASRGIEIKTVRPRFSIATLYTATPRNPRVRVVFDRQGQVLRAEILRSSGYADIDGPILNALYAWRASGKMLQEMKSSTFEWQGSILLVDEPDTP